MMNSESKFISLDDGFISQEKSKPKFMTSLFCIFSMVFYFNLEGDYHGCQINERHSILDGTQSYRSEWAYLDHQVVSVEAVPLRFEDLRAMSRQFSWGNKRGVGCVMKDVQFFESFTFNGTNYSLYDCVYLSGKDEHEPYIGKIVRIWEQRDGKKKVEILWFFRPSELQNYFGEHEPLEKEIFLASGEGVGASNINPLEVIAGKCFVLCTSKDARNPQPSKDALDLADYIFYRTFHVGNFTIFEKIADRIIDIEVEHLLNRDEDVKSFRNKANWSLSNDKPSRKMRPDDDSVRSSDHIQNENIVKLKLKNWDEDSNSFQNKANMSLSDDNPSMKMRPDDDSGRPSDHIQNKNIVRLKFKPLFNRDEDSNSFKNKANMSLSDDKPSKKMRSNDDFVRPSVLNKNIAEHLVNQYENSTSL